MVRQAEAAVVDGGGGGRGWSPRVQPRTLPRYERISVVPKQSIFWRIVMLLKTRRIAVMSQLLLAGSSHLPHRLQ